MASILRIFLFFFFFFFIWRPSVVEVWLGEVVAAVVVVAARLVLHEVDAMVPRWCLLPLLPWRKKKKAPTWYHDDHHVKNEACGHHDHGGHDLA